MTHAEAEKELAELEPRVDEAWAAHCQEVEAWQRDYDYLRKQIDAMVANKSQLVGVTMDRWLPLFTRKQKLKAFLELTPI